jgi:MATE family multidrug resistance protein
VVDVAMAGHASAQDLAGVSLGVSVWNMFIITMMGMHDVGESDRVAHQVGAGELWTGCRISCARACGRRSESVLLAMPAGQSRTAQVFDHADAGACACASLAPRTFTLITSFAHAGLFACYRVLYGYSTSMNQTKPLMVIALISLLINIVVNSLLVFGTLGFPRLGGAGCAWATLIVWLLTWLLCCGGCNTLGLTVAHGH